MKSMPTYIAPPTTDTSLHRLFKTEICASLFATLGPVGCRFGIAEVPDIRSSNGLCVLARGENIFERTMEAVRVCNLYSIEPTFWRCHILSF